jgi:hypothetical protein
MGLPVRRRKSKGRSTPYALRSGPAVWMKEYSLPAGSTGEGGLGLRPRPLPQAVTNIWSACINDGACSETRASTFAEPHTSFWSTVMSPRYWEGDYLVRSRSPALFLV